MPPVAPEPWDGVLPTVWYPASASQMMYDIRSDSYATFRDVLINDRVLFIDATFRTYPDRDHRVMSGLPWRLLDAYWFPNIDKFSCFGSLSGVAGLNEDTLDTAYDGVFAEPDEFNSNKEHGLFIEHNYKVRTGAAN